MKTPWKTLFISRKLSKIYRRQPKRNKENVTNKIPRKGYSEKKIFAFFLFRLAIECESFKPICIAKFEFLVVLFGTFKRYISNRKIGEHEKVYEKFKLSKEKIHSKTEKR